MSDTWKEATYLSFKWQFLSLSGVRFFGPPDSVKKWNLHADYPIRYFLWKINRDAWADLDQWKLSEAVIHQCVKSLKQKLEHFSSRLVDSEFIDPEFDFPKTLIEHRTSELDSDELVFACLDHDWFKSLVASTGFPLKWDMIPTILALVHITNGVELLNANDRMMAAALAIKAKEWLMQGRQLRAVHSHDWLHKKRLAESGANAAHSENRRVRKEAIEMYLAHSWPSKMQAARVIGKTVSRAELVVLRWIREHSRQV